MKSHASRPSTGRDLVLVSWNGREPPLARLLLDVPPQFELLVFDYSGQAGISGSAVPGLPPHVNAVLLSEKTECKGDIYQALARHLEARRSQDGAAELPGFVALIDDDVMLSTHDIHRLLHIGRCHGLHCFSAALSHDSEYTHRWMLHVPHQQWREALWVEVMMPFYDTRLFLAAAAHFEGNISSWGIDKYLFPTVQKLEGFERTAIVDAVVASHIRPITSGDGAFRHGMTAAQERDRLRDQCLKMILERQPALHGSRWFRQVFEQRHVRTRWQQLAYGLGRPLRRWLDRSN